MDWAKSRTLSWWLVEMELSFGAGAVDRDRRRNGARGGCGRCGGALSIDYPALSSQQTKRLAQYDAACQPPIAATVAAQTFRHIVAPAAIRSEHSRKLLSWSQTKSARKPVPPHTRCIYRGMCTTWPWQNPTIYEE
ncbi:hypothetical protein E4U56_007792 [Claviceps arundinis]|uniref:Uncharacterized protein n=1 Tax=Claviceps arundinis TaxID=1623583 RepID=A0A9P7MZY8_9HYPO|nr:hypothetical protein E4U56_007792 [Claviceps arundinis]